MAKCLDLKPDLIFALAQAPLTPDVLDRMRQFEFTTAFWFVEDCREFTYWKQVASKYDCFFAIQKREIFGDLESLGATEFHYLPLGCDPNVHRQIELSDEDEKRFSSDASFVGAGYYNRQIFFQGLLDLDFKIWGTDWNLASPVGRLVQEKSRRVTPRETVKIFNGSKININLHSSTYHQGVNPQGDFVNPRTFEIAACQGFQVADPRSHLPELFEPDQEVVCFETIEDLREKVAYYLAHPEERECIATRGQERANRDHTYLKRVTRALELIVEKVPSRFLTLKEKVPTPERLIVEAGADTELGRFLSRFKRQDALTLDSIVSDIEGGEGKLTEPEIIFLLMHEFSKYKAGAREGSGE
jgi:spore maturation protein CgeB